MKIISKNMVERRNQKVHTKAERAILENIDSPFIVQLHYAFQTCDKLYLVMDFMIAGKFNSFIFLPTFLVQANCFII